MRRGHQNAGGWRNESHRNFRPRTGAPPQIRPSRGFILDTPLRFQSPGPRGFHRPNFHGPSGHRDIHGDNDRDSYHYNRPRPQAQQRQILPYLQQMRQNKSENNAFNSVPESNYHINTMGDVDFRHKTVESSHNQRPSPWVVPPFEMRQQTNPIYERRNYDTPYRRDSFETNRLPSSDFGGHRPHSTDYYGNNTTPDKDNLNTFSHSIDDTVDIIRKKLQNRGEPQQHTEQSQNEERINDVRNPAPEPSKSYQHEGRGSHRKRIQRQKSNVKISCDKMKNKIVHQLFKMDKDKIHKLMDNPNSSSKFEYAISSLITESQNSFNRHMRSVAEKSLCSSSSEFIQNDNNTVYEDTFMKEMQCLLDPQDTVLLEDIKPLVMAEISNLLQLDDYDHRLEPHDYNPYDNSDQQPNYDQNDGINEYSNDHYDYQSENDYVNNEHNQTTEDIQNYIEPPSPPESKPLFQRRPSDWNHRQENDERQNNKRRSFDKANEPQRSPSPLPLFDLNTEQFSEDEDPFAELDKQYHVAVDHNFIEDDYSSPQQTPTKNKNVSPNTTKPPLDSLCTPEKPLDIKKEIDTQLMELATSPLKLNVQEFNSKHRNQIKTDKIVVKQEIVVETKTCAQVETTPSKGSLIPKSRKRSVDQKPSHRKEKRKKSDSCGETSKQILNKNIIINVNDCAAKASENCESAKSIFNLFFSKEQSNSNESQKDSKKLNESSSKEYSDKYVKRKDSLKKNKSNEKKETNSNISSHSILSPTANSDSSVTCQTPTKTDPKAKLKTFDIFEQQPKKAGAPHQPLRNTAPAPVTTQKATVENKKLNLTLSSNRKKKHIAVQVVSKVDTRGVQTIARRLISKATQTTSVTISNTNVNSTDTLERMKEIDMEIQNLLQEKFKLYSSLESKNAIPATMQTLGMTVLNVTPAQDTDDANSFNEDAIVDDFTNIPVEELEQIAFESVQEETPSTNKKTHRNRALSKDRKNSESPTAQSKRSNKKEKTPNISLIEQIISDERPLEEIITLDELESPNPSSKKKQTKKKGCRKKQIKFTTPEVIIENPPIKQCHVVVLREDLNKLLSKIMENKVKEVTQDNVQNLDDCEVIPVSDDDCHLKLDETPPKESQVIEESVVNDVQIDMLDVSEDIVIGDDVVCEVKDDKVEIERSDVINEEVIMDNSQSSVEECAAQDAGQSTEMCKIYDYSADENLRRDATIVTGNADAVLAIECFENDFIAACLDGNVYHFSGSGQLMNTLRGSNLAVTCLTIVKEKYGTTVYTGSLDSRIRYYDLETGLEKGPECNVLSPIQTMDRAWDTIFVGTRTGFVLQFECKNNMLIPVSTVKFSEQAILALRALKEGPRKVLLVAARSEDVVIKDAATGLLLRTLEGPKMTVYTLLFEEGKVYCGTSSNQIHVFDYASGSHVGAHRGGKGAVCVRAAGGLVFAGCYDGCVYVFREGAPAPAAVLRGPNLMLLALAVRGTKIIAGYKDRSLYIWKIPLAILQEMVL